MRKSCAVLALALAAPVVCAQTANGQLQRVAILAKAENPAFAGFNSQRSQTGFTSAHMAMTGVVPVVTPKTHLQTGKQMSQAK
ncbi:MAG: hypothetical protein IPM78_10325 [Moraxellaceae bacterium]|nr:hypothetical protein [Moraxellaceae bacterium]